MKTLKEIKTLEQKKSYYKRNSEKIYQKRKIWLEKNKEKYRAYMREYMRMTRPIKFNWCSIKNGKLHPKFFDEKIMFSDTDNKYIYKTNNVKLNKEIELKALYKYEKNCKV